MINLEVRDGDWSLKVDVDDRGSAGTVDPLDRRISYTVTYSWRGLRSNYLHYSTLESYGQRPLDIRMMFGEIWHCPDLERWKREVAHEIERRNMRRTPVFRTLDPTTMMIPHGDDLDRLMTQW